MESTAPELILLKQQRVKLLTAKVAAIKNDGLAFYKPHPKQDHFHRSLAKRRGAFTGNRFGKSTMGCAEDCAWLRGERPWLSRDDLGRRFGIPQRPVKGLVITTDWDKVEEIWSGQDGKLWKFLPKDGFIKSVSRNHSGAVDTVFCNGPFGLSTLRFDTVKSFMSNPQGSESSDWDFVHVDEPCPEQMFKAVGRGLVDRDGSAWFTLTALSEPWITDAFDVDGIFKGISYVMEGTIYDNPYLSLSAIKAYETTLTEDEKECRLFGKPLHKAGLIYKAFQSDKHILSALPKGWKSWMEPPLDWSYYLYIDPHPHTPHMVLFLVVDPFGRKYYWADLFEKCLISQLCEKIKVVLGGRRLIRARCDPIAYIEDPINGENMAAEFFRCGVSVEKASKDLSRGILRVNEALQQKEQWPVFSPECRRALWEIKRYHWDEKTGKPVDVDDHAMECLYRSILDEPCYVDMAASVPVEDETFGITPRLDLEPLKFNETVITRLDLMLN